MEELKYGAIDALSLLGGNVWQMALPTAVTCFGVLVPFIIRDYENVNIAGVSWIPGIAVAVLNLTGNNQKQLI